MSRYICIHGHFYQPPRENPWLESIELQDSAYPYHDWNQRITAESYAPNTASRILDKERKIIDIINNYSKISFNFGPTLLSWMEHNEPEIYEAILDADKKSQARFSGHGAALAQVYNHIIMPLANTYDKRTQILWGIRDFEKRFKRYPEGMWLAETAVDLETLDILAECGIKFTVLAPRQAHRVRALDGGRWKSVKNSKVDPKMPYVCHLPSGRSIALFFYDGPVAQDIAFGGLLENGERFANRLVSAFAHEDPHPQLVHIATDGESYGHHHRDGEMALTYCLYHIETHDLASITIYPEYLEKYSPTHEVEIYENSSWSCVHGIERWRSNCGCNSGGHQGWNQEWRAPLRGALDWLRDNVLKIFEEQTNTLLQDPWKARDDYIYVILDRDNGSIDSFIKKHQARELTHEEKVKVITLFEAQRHAMLMYTSCGWFFDEISGIETVQIIQYAARVMQLIEDVSGIKFQESFIGILEGAPSNLNNFNNAADIYKAYVEPSVLDLTRVGAHYVVSSLFREYEDTTELYCYTIKNIRYELMNIGKQKLTMGTVAVRSNITLHELVVSFAVMHLGEHNIVGGVREFGGDEAFDTTFKEIKSVFKKNQIAEIVRTLDKHFSSHSYSIWHLFRDEQREILDDIFRETSADIEKSFTAVYDRYYPVLESMEGHTIHMPEHFSSVIKFVVSTNLRRVLEAEEIDFKKLEELVHRVNRWNIRLDAVTLNFIASNTVENVIQKCSHNAYDTGLLEALLSLLRLLSQLPLDLDLWKSQNMYFRLGNDLKATMQQKRDQGDGHAAQWLACFEELGNYLKVRIA